MRPHPQHFDDVFFFQNLIHKSVLDVDAARLSGRRPVFRMAGAFGRDRRPELLSFRPEAGRSQLTSILLRLLGE